MLFVLLLLFIAGVLSGSEPSAGGFGDLFFDVSDNITPTNITFVLYPYQDGYVSMKEANESFSSWQNNDLKVWSDWDRLSHGVRWVMHSYIRFNTSRLLTSPYAQRPIVKAWLTLTSSGGHEAVSNYSITRLSLVRYSAPSNPIYNTPNFWYEKGDPAIQNSSKILTWNLASGFTMEPNTQERRWWVPEFMFHAFTYHVDVTSMMNQIRQRGQADAHFKLWCNAATQLGDSNADKTAATYFSRHVGSGPYLVIQY